MSRMLTRLFNVGRQTCHKDKAKKEKIKKKKK